MEQNSWYGARGAVNKTFIADVWKSESKRRGPTCFVERSGWALSVLADEHQKALCIKAVQKEGKSIS
jgi:hypothetical protein